MYCIFFPLSKARIRRYASSKILGAALSNLHFIVIIRVRGACLLAHHGNELHQLGENKACNDETLIDPELKYAENFGNMNANTPKGSPEYRPNTALPFKVMQVNTTQNKSLRTATHGLLIFGDLAGFDPGEDIYHQQNYRKQQKDQQQSQHHHVGELSTKNPENISNLPGKHTENQSSSNDTCVEEAKRNTSKKDTSRPIGKHNNTHNVIYEADR
ncbi:unnamed protein product [Trichobilharzia regenti]|nr:unnamed protein product [Trichobilharzia regenti]